MAANKRKIKVEAIDKKVFNCFNGTLGQASIDLRGILTDEEYGLIRDKAVKDGTCTGFAFMAIASTINYMLSSKKTKIKMINELNWDINLNTFAIVVGPKSCGKSPAVKFFIKEPLKDLDPFWRKTVRSLFI